MGVTGLTSTSRVKYRSATCQNSGFLKVSGSRFQGVGGKSNSGFGVTADQHGPHDTKNPELWEGAAGFYPSALLFEVC